jgi:hypothetical protein
MPNIFKHIFYNNSMSAIRGVRKETANSVTLN